MKLIINIPDEMYDDIKHGYICSEYADTLIQLIPNSAPYEERPQVEIANKVWRLYEKYQSHLATRVIEFGDELKELLGKYQKGGAE